MKDNVQRDSIFAQPQANIGDFVFDEKVADVFEDMIQRSVPGYSAIINMIGILAEQYGQENSNCYDLGCSLGASTLAMRQRIDKEGVRIVSVDNSEAMIDTCRQNIERVDSHISVDLMCDDIRHVDIQKASMVVLNFTLQFIAPDERQALLQKVYDGLLPSGVLIISEKITFDNPEEQTFQAELHRTFKKLNGYSDLEISQKRTALENVLIPDTLDQHQRRLQAVGFDHSNVWFQCFNFASMIAFK